MTVTVAELRRRFQTAKSKRVITDGLYSDCYKYAIPYRDGFYGSKEGRANTEAIFDSTAVDSTVNFANMLHDGFTPPEQRWFEFAAGSEVQGVDKDRVKDLLHKVTVRWFELIWQTNFDTEINQCYLDLAVGMGTIGIRDYADDQTKPATFIAVPPNEVYTCEGRQGFIDTVFREFSLAPRQIKLNWPDAVFNENEWQQLNPTIGTGENKIEVVEATYTDYATGKTRYCVFLAKDDKEIVKRVLTYNNWIPFRWSVVSGEQSGRGVIVNALADIKTANKTVELVLQNASLAVAGVYTGVDDGVLNPDTVEIAPGVVIPVAANGGNYGRSLDVLPRSGDFSVAELVLKDLRQSIRRKLLDDDLAPLDDAVRSSQEVAVRQARLAKRAGPNFGRLKTEFMVNFIKSTTDMWIAKGLLPPLKIDGKLITLRYKSPMARLQTEEELRNLDSYIARLNAHTQGLASMAVKPEEYVHHVAELSGIPVPLLATKDQLTQLQQQMGSAIGQGAPMGEAMVKGMIGK